MKDAQKRIAKILDATDALRTKRREAIAQLDALLKSTFLDMFGDPATNPKFFQKETLKTVFQFTTGKLDSNAAIEGGKYPFFTCAGETYSINKYAFNWKLFYLQETTPMPTTRLSSIKENSMRIRDTYVITLDENVLSYKYAQFALEYMLGDLKRFSKGSSTKYLTLKILNRMPILVPPLPLQTKFAAIVNSVEQQKFRMKTHLTELDTLFASLQQRAFNGEL